MPIDLYLTTMSQVEFIVHINNEGVNKLIEQLYLYMSSVEQVDVNCRTLSMRKRNLSSTTPQSSEKLGKLHKSGTLSGVV